MIHVKNAKLIAASIVVFVLWVLGSTRLTAEQQNVPSTGVASAKEKSLAAFQTMLKVIKSPRCMNCHPSGDVPRQGDDQHFHKLGVSRGKANQGGVVQKCETCHHHQNNEYANVPGAPHWGLAPKSMGWEGLSDLELGKALLDKRKNGNRSPQDLVEHMGQDSLVLWAWNPGLGRTPPPVPLAAFRQSLNEWLSNGALIPQ